MKHRILVTFGLLVALVAMLVITIPAQGATSQAPRIRSGKNSGSLNWAGYAAEYPSMQNPSSNMVTDVKGTWVVPGVTGTNKKTYSSIWVGIDGYSSSTVEQIGTEQDYINGRPVYSAWYEMYPAYPVTIPLTIKAGDTITAEVQYTGSGHFTLTLDDVSDSSPAFSIDQVSTVAQLSSAEWIVEAPWLGTVLPLANFGSATFTDASATINGKNNEIDGWGSGTYDLINMVSRSGKLKAQTGPLTDNGQSSSFKVTWVSN
jgi:Peptidase A4 family